MVGAGDPGGEGTQPGDTTQSIGEALNTAGWRQGSVFEAPGLSYVCHELAPPGSEEPLAIRVRRVRARERCVLVTQTCDLVDSVSEPTVEALVCTVQSQKFVEAWLPNTVQWFVVDRERRLVAEAKYRVHIDKQALLRFAPEPWPGTRESLGQFMRWLGRRFDRPALADAVVDVFQKPLVEMFRRLASEGNERFGLVNQVVRDVRIVAPEDEEPAFPVAVTLVLVLWEARISKEAEDAIRWLAGEIEGTINPERVRLREIAMRSDEELSVADYFRSAPVFFEYLTYGGEEQMGAAPFGPA